MSRDVVVTLSCSVDAQWFVDYAGDSDTGAGGFSTSLSSGDSLTVPGGMGGVGQTVQSFSFGLPGLQGQFAFGNPFIGYPYAWFANMYELVDGEWMVVVDDLTIRLSEGDSDSSVQRGGFVFRVWRGADDSCGSVWCGDYVKCMGLELLGGEAS